MNQFDVAARKAAEDIENYEDKHESYLSLNGSKEITAEIIAKSHADLRATYDLLVELAINVDTLNMCPEEANCGKCNRVYELLTNPLVQAAIERSKE